MTEEIRQSTFKVKASAVDSHYGIRPDPGAILFLKSDYQLIYGDGYNWLDIGPGADRKAAIALDAKHPFDTVFVGGVEQQVKFYDTIPYNYGGKFKPFGVNKLRILGSFDVDLWAEFIVSSCHPNTNLTIRSKYNGFELERKIWLNAMDNDRLVQSYAIFTANPSALWSVWAETDKDCTLTVHSVKIGFHERT